MIKKKILIADDEEDILELLSYNLSKAGLDVKLARNGKEAVELVKTWKPDLILMDIVMPVMDGIEACRLIRESSSRKETFIVFISGRTEEYSEIAAFDAGGNDYIIKPIKPRALISRIEAYFKRSTGTRNVGQTLIKIKNMSIDKESYTVFKDSEKITLSRKEFDLLFLLCQYPNKVFNREELHQKVWGAEADLISRTVDVHIQKIRKKIGAEYINTIKGMGYKLEP